jgi:hypothetical protein
MLRKIWFAAVLTAAVTTVAYAQGRGGGAPGGFGGPGGFGPRDTSEVLAKELKLTDQQKPEVFAILDEGQKQTSALLTKIRDGRTAFIDSTMGSKPVEPALKNITDLFAQVIGIEADAIAKVMAKLDNKQKEKAAKVFDMSGLFLSGNWKTAAR